MTEGQTVMLFAHIVRVGCIILVLWVLAWMLFIEPAGRRKRKQRRKQAFENWLDEEHSESIMPTLIEHEEEDFF